MKNRSWKHFETNSRKRNQYIFFHNFYINEGGKKSGNIKKVAKYKKK